MKFFTKKSIMQKIIIVLIALILVNFIVAPYKTYAGDGLDKFIGSLLKEIVQMVASLGDIIMGALNNFMVGADGGIAGLGSALLDANDPNLRDEGSWLHADQSAEADIVFDNDNPINTSSFFSGWSGFDFGIPNMIYSPENIFANNIPALDVNFLRPNTYTSVKTGDEVEVNSSEELNNMSNDDENKKFVSSALTLQSTISSWYKSFRNIAIVGLLSVLIYLGIRILLSSTAADKAKYKESIKDWVVALCLIFVINFIMSGILMITQACNQLFANNINEGIVVQVKESNAPAGFFSDANNGNSDSQGKFKTNVMGLIRFQAQSDDGSKAVTYTILYAVLIIYTIIFTVVYFKRFLYMAFFTMIAPLVALTYPIDKAGDGKAQAFNIWFKEYTMNAVIQPVHLILYSVFVGSATDLVIQNPIYALVAVGFLIPAEKFIKKMFKLDKADTPGGLGSFAGGALTMSAMNRLASGGSSEKDKKSINGKSEKGDDAENGSHIFGRTNEGKLKLFQGENNETADDSSNRHDQSDVSSNQDNNNENTSEYPEGFQPVDDEHRRLSQERQMRGEMDNEEGNDNISERGEALDARANHQDTGEGPTLNAGERTSQNLDNPQIREGWKGRLAKRAAIAGKRTLFNNAGKAARFTARSVGKVVGAGMGATIGLAAGIASGDMSKVFAYAGAGAMAGKAIGNRVQNYGTNLARGAKGLASGANRAINEEMYGYEYAQKKEIQKQNKKARKQFLKDENEIKKARKLMADMKYNGDVETIMKAKADYLEAGITDEKLINNAIKAEYKRNKNTKFDGDEHKRFVDTAAFVDENGIKKSDILSDKGRKTAETSVENYVEGDENRREVMGYVTDLFGVRNSYEEKGKYGKNQIDARRRQATTSNSTQNSSQTRTGSNRNPSSTRRTNSNA